VLFGGGGSDTRQGGRGDDRMSGGSGIDHFRFDLSADQGTDTVRDFDRRHDVLAFSGITDAGTTGLVDDLDQISTFTDLGRHKDVVVDLANGTKLVFAGLGTGHADSWADIVLHPSSDLILV
jgi:Ca2+-binding RTX toxin-like protein